MEWMNHSHAVRMGRSESRTQARSNHAMLLLSGRNLERRRQLREMAQGTCQCEGEVGRKVLALRWGR